LSLLVQKGRNIVIKELRKLGFEPTSESLNRRSGPIEVESPKSVSFQVRTSAGANEPRRWDAGKLDKSKISDWHFYIFINRWKDESKPHELFVIPSKYLLEVVEWDRHRPKYNMTRDEEIRFKNNWTPILDYINKM
jgi:hypothetical protein